MLCIDKNLDFSPKTLATIVDYLPLSSLWAWNFSSIAPILLMTSSILVVYSCKVAPWACFFSLSFSLKVSRRTIGTHLRHSCSSPTCTWHLSVLGYSGGMVVVSSGSGRHSLMQGKDWPSCSTAYCVSAISEIFSGACRILLCSWVNLNAAGKFAPFDKFRPVTKYLLCYFATSFPI